MKIEDYVGKRVVDRLTGQEGTCIGIEVWLFGCTNLRIVPFIDGSSLPGVKLIDEIVLPKGRIRISGGKDETDGFIFDYNMLRLYLGKKLKDRVTGIKGICAGMSFSLYDDLVAAIITKNGRLLSMDIGRLSVIGKGVKPSDVRKEGASIGGGIFPAKHALAVY